MTYALTPRSGKPNGVFAPRKYTSCLRGPGRLFPFFPISLSPSPPHVCGGSIGVGISQGLRAATMSLIPSGRGNAYSSPYR